MSTVFAYPVSAKGPGTLVGGGSPNPAFIGGGPVQNQDFSLISDALQTGPAYIDSRYNSWTFVWGSKFYDTSTPPLLVPAASTYDAANSFVVVTLRAVSPISDGTQVSFTDSIGNTGTLAAGDFVDGASRGEKNLFFITPNLGSVGGLFNYSYTFTVSGPMAWAVGVGLCYLGLNTVVIAGSTSTPSALVSSPLTVMPTVANRPIVAWTYGSADHLVQTGAQVKVYQSSVYTGGGFDPATTAGASFDSGVVRTSCNTMQVIDALDTTKTWRAYVRVRDSAGTFSSWVFRQFTFTSIGAPTITAPTGAYTGASRPTIAVSIGAGIQPANLLVQAQDASGALLWDAVAQRTPSVNLLTEAGFENGFFETTTLVNMPTFSLDETFCHAGKRSLKVISTANGVINGVNLTSVVSVAQSSDVVGSAWVWAPAGTAMRMLVRDLGGGTFGTFTDFTGSGDWDLISASWTAGGASTYKPTLHIIGPTNTAFTWWVDDVSLISSSLATVTAPVQLEPGVTTTLSAFAYNLDILAGTSTTATVTPNYDVTTAAPTASAASGTYDQVNGRVTFSLTRAAGYTGNATAEVQRSDDAGTTYVFVPGGPYAINTTGAVATIQDYACPPSTTPLYRYRLVGQADTSNPRPHTWVAVVPTGGPLTAQSWIKDYAAAWATNRPVSASAVESFSIASTEQGAQVFTPLSATRPVVARGTISGKTVQVSFRSSSKAEYDALEALRLTQHILLVQFPWGDQLWCRPLDGRQSKLLPTRQHAATPVWFHAWTLQEVDQPV